MTAMAALKLVLSLLWVGVGTSSVVNLEKRIIGGRPCGPTESLHHVLLLRSNGQFCGGSLITNQWILTAAHCWTDGVVTTAYFGVYTGAKLHVSISESPEMYEDISHGQVRRHDLMLLKLPDSVQLPSNVKPIDLPDCNNQPLVHDMVQIFGHASSTMGPNKKRQPGFNPTLQCADIEVADCSHITLKHTTYSYQHWFCGQSPGVDTCSGDSGGGIVFRDMIYGVHAFTMDSQYACSEPAGFMKICHEPYLKWIKTTIGLNSQQVKASGLVWLK